MSTVHQHGAGSAPPLDGDDPRLFPMLTEAQVELLARHGEVRSTAAGEVLFRQWSETHDVMVVRDGTASVLVGSAEEQRELVRHRTCGRRQLAIKALSRAPVDVTVVDRTNHHLLHPVATPARNATASSRVRRRWPGAVVS